MLIQKLIFVLLWLFFAGPLTSNHLFSVDAGTLQRNLYSLQSCFTYPLNITVYPSKKQDAGVTVCLHGYGGDCQTGAVISQSINEHVVSFDFPDAGITNRPNTQLATTFGTIQELLPAIYVIKQCLIAGNLEAINLYGFSAGGGAVVNLLAVLNGQHYDRELASIGVSNDDKVKILQAVQRGYVILDCPLKSIDEIVDYRGNNPQLVAMAKVYEKNHLRPIDSLQNLKGLALTVIVNFQDPDEALSNRDDLFYIQRLESANSNGRTIAVISHNEGHVAYHPALWQEYQSLYHNLVEFRNCN